MSEKPDRSQKTEPPTPKRKRDARRKGQIPRSPEIVAWTSLLLATWLGPMLFGRLDDGLTTAFTTLTKVMADPQPERMVPALGSAMYNAGLGIAPFLGLMMLVGIAGNLAQVGIVLTGEPLKPKFSRLNPVKGLKKILSVEGLWQTAKSALKLAAIAMIVLPAVRGTSQHLVQGGYLTLGTTITWLGREILSLTKMVALVGLGIAAADYAFQRRRHAKDLMMTKQELRQEHRTSEGDPQVKNRIRSMQRGLSRNRMLAGVADANVVITNPTHLAVALRYVPGQGPPRVVAKGADHMAQRIREKAAEHGVPIVQAKPIARALYHACRVDEDIPFELFAGVARVLAFVQRVASRVALGGAFVLPGV